MALNETDEKLKKPLNKSNVEGLVIKPCPLCKEKEDLTPMDSNAGDNWAIICWQCDYIGPIGDNADEAIQLHNKAVL